MLERHNWHDAMTARLAQFAWTTSREGEEWLRVRFAYDSYEYREHPDIIQTLATLYSTEMGRLADAVPFFVSADMCKLVEHARDSFAPEPIYPTDVLKMHGFMWYENAIPILDRWGDTVPLRAVSWAPMMADAEVKPDRLLTRDDEVREWIEQRQAEGRADGLAITLYTEQGVISDFDRAGIVNRPPVEVLHMTPWWWAMSYSGNDATVDERPTGADAWWRTVQSTWRLMQQHIAVRHNEQPTRPQRREAKRVNVSSDDVVIVRLRREKSPTNGEPMSERHFSHRFIRDGHWRNQWYESAQMHRQIYIAPTIVGDDSLPLVIKPKRVFNWNR